MASRRITDDISEVDFLLCALARQTVNDAVNLIMLANEFLGRVHKPIQTRNDTEDNGDANTEVSLLCDLKIPFHHDHER